MIEIYKPRPVGRKHLTIAKDRLFEFDVETLIGGHDVYVAQVLVNSVVDLKEMNNSKIDGPGVTLFGVDLVFTDGKEPTAGKVTLEHTVWVSGPAKNRNPIELGVLSQVRV